MSNVTVPSHKSSLEAYPEIIFNLVNLWGNFECLAYMDRILFNTSPTAKYSFTAEQFDDLELLQNLYIGGWKELIRHPITEDIKHNALFKRLLKDQDAWIFAD